eukprot:Opistho-2@66910
MASPSVVAEACDYAVAHGIVMGASTAGESGKAHVVSHAPFTLAPSPFPASQYRAAVDLQPHFNYLVDRISRDYDFLKATLRGAIQSDPFTARLWDIYEESIRGAPQRITLGLFRSDYMLHGGSDDDVREGRIKQVEINTIAASFGSLGTFMSDLHAYVTSREETPTPREALPKNGALAGLAAGMAHAWRLYVADAERTRDTSAPPPLPPVVVMIVQPGETNSYDQRHLEHALWESHGIRMLRRSLRDFLERGSTEGDGGALSIDGREVAVAYFRAGYTPRDYPSDGEWTARSLIETSRAVKCPSIAVHLAGAKKVQQAVAVPGVLERFVSDPFVVDRLRESFTGLYSLDPGADGDANVALALRDPARYVLKPQREGGGNNLYGDDVVAALSSMTPEERSAYILMDLIQPPSVANHYVRSGVATPARMVGELGVFGAIIREGDCIVRNDACGHLLRSKPVGVNDGGVAAGVAVLDSPLLV